MPNLFNSDELPPYVDPSRDYYSELVGEGLKYADNQAFARSRVEADLQIARLEAEQKGLRDELATRIKYEEFLDKLNTAPPVTTTLPPSGEPAKDTSAIRPEDIERLLEEKLRQRDYEKTAEQNLNIVVSKLQETYGPNYAQHLKRQTHELGMSEQAVRNLASSNPKVLFKLLGIGEVAKGDNLFQAPPRTSTTFTPSASGTKRGDAYYEEIRRKEPNLYWSPKIQNEIFTQVKELGEDYYK